MSKLDDIHAMLMDAEDELTFNEVTHPCFLIQHDNPIAQQSPGPGRLQRDTFIQTAIDYLPDIKTGASLLLNGEPWKAIRIERIQDGMMYQVWLQVDHG